MAINFPNSPSLNEKYTENNKTWVWDGIAWNVVEGNSNYKGNNAIINGNFDIWQRGTSQGFPGLLADRWRVLSSGISDISQSRGSFTIGQTDVPNNPTYYHSSLISTTPTGTTNYKTLATRIENVRTFSGETVTLSFWARANNISSRTIATEFSQHFGSGGSSSVLGIGVTQHTLTQTWQKFTTTVDIPSISGKSIGDNTNGLELRFWLSAGSSLDSRTGGIGNKDGNFQIAQVKVEPGIIDTPFIPRTYAEELSLCERYYQILRLRRLLGITYTPNGDTRLNVDFRTEMRDTPSVIQWSSTTNVIATGSGGNAVNVSLGSLSFQAEKWSVALTQIGGASNLSGAGTVAAWGNNNGDLELRLDAENI